MISDLNADPPARATQAPRLAILVLGPHRCGTSALTRVLNLLGAELPANLLPPVENNNKLGFWESRDLMELHDEILTGVDSSWDDPGPFPAEWFDSPAAAAYRERIVAFMHAEFADAPLCVIKDPRLCRLLPLWRDALVDAAWTPMSVLSVRHPMESAISLAVRDQLSRSQGRLLWLRHVLEAELHSRDIIRSIVSYDMLLNDWRATTARVSRDLGLRWPHRTHARAEQIDDYLRPANRHHTAPVAAPSLAPIALDWIARTHAALTDLAHNVRPNKARRTLDKIRRAIGKADQVFAPVVAQARTSAVALALDTSVSREQAQAAAAMEREAHNAQMDEARAAADAAACEHERVLHETRGQIARLQDALADQLREQAAALEDLNAQLARAESEAESGNNEAKALRDALTSSSGEIESLGKHLHAHREDARELRVTLRDLAATVGKQERTIAGFRDDITQGQEALAERSVQIQRLAGDLESNTVQRKLVEAQLHQVEAARDAADKRIQELEQCTHQLGAEASSHRGELATLRQALNEKEELLAGTRDALEARESEFQELNTRLRRFTSAASAQGIAQGLTVSQLRTNAARGRKALSEARRELALAQRHLHRIAHSRAGRLLSAFEPAGRATNSIDTHTPTTAPVSVRRLRKAIRDSGLFDSGYYLRENPDVSKSNMDPLEHFVRFGAMEGRAPNPLFDMGYYRARNPDIDRHHINPLWHYLSLHCSGRATPHPLFDIHFYLYENPDVAASGMDPIAHYLCHGIAESRNPHPLFDTRHYLDHGEDLDPNVVNPLAHYYTQGAFEGRDPHPLFDSSYYLMGNPDVLHQGVNPLRHYMDAGDSECRKPHELFDTGFYRHQLSEAGLGDRNALVHYVEIGAYEGFDPNPSFDSTFYLAGLDHEAATTNPLVHYLQHGLAEGRAIRPPGNDSPTTTMVANADPMQPASEPADADDTAGGDWLDSVELGTIPEIRIAQDQLARTRVLAFYLPQFHPIPENDAWWGEGFTEWTNVTRARPQYAGHQQPRLPGALGLYDLRLADVRVKQAALARDHGVAGFCYHHYWFNGQRLLEHPLNEVLATGRPDFPFCISWANENWTRRWDGKEDAVLMSQKHSLASDRQFIIDTLPILDDERYIRVDDRPVLLVYRADLMQCAAETAAVWRDECWRAGIGDIHLCAVSFMTSDPRPLGFDAAVEFPPHHFPAATITGRAPGLTPGFDGKILDYASGVNTVITRPPEVDYRLYQTVMPGWDNTARRGSSATVFVGDTPALYERWLRSAVAYRQPDDGVHDNLVFVNAWNEWAEGAVLEPSERDGKAYLDATARAVRTSGTTPAADRHQPAITHTIADAGVARLPHVPQPAPIQTAEHTTLLQRLGLPLGRRGRYWQGGHQQRVAPDAQKVLFVSHDAALAGAQRVMLELLRHFAPMEGVDCHLLLCGAGPLESAFKDLARVCSLTDLMARGANRADALKRALDDVDGFSAALCNTAAVTDVVAACSARGIPVLAYVHELPTTIESMLGGRPSMDRLLSGATSIITVSHFVRDRLCAAYDVAGDRIQVIHMGIFPGHREIFTRAEARQRVQRELGYPPEMFLVLGCGSVHPRKGNDLFIQMARRAISSSPHGQRMRFLWVGADQDGPSFRSWCEHDMAGSGLSPQVRFLGERADPSLYFAAADAFALTSREDPFPLVNLEAMAAGLPVVCFADVGGAPEALLPDAGVVVPFLDVAEMGDRIAELSSNPDLSNALGRSALERTETRFTWQIYIEGITHALLSIAKPPIESLGKGIPGPERNPGVRP